MLHLLFLIISPFVSSEESNFQDLCYTDGHLHKGARCRFFAMVIDAGSTGTRLHLYRFRHNPQPHALPFDVEEEIFKEVKPGLSSFASHPSEAAASVRQLLDYAAAFIPQQLHQRTPVVLKATAGLRLLPDHLGQDIMSAVEEEVQSSPFWTNEDAVEILSGSDEGVYSWFTLNLLLKTLYTKLGNEIQEPKPKRSVAAFDLGGGSTQVTFWPTDPRTLQELPDYERDIHFFDSKFTLFTHSFLGNGLVASRLSILERTSEEERQKGVALEENQLASHCLPLGFNIPNWDYAMKTWIVSNSSTPSFAACVESAKKFVAESGIMKLKELRGRPVYLFSYFFDRALQAGLVKDNNGGSTTPAKLLKAAEKACSMTAKDLEDVPHWAPWQCLDLVYIHSLLTEGYGFRNDQPLHMAKKIRDMEVSWAQGLSFALVDTFHETALPDVDDADSSNSTVAQLISLLHQGTTNVLEYFNLIS